MKPKLKKALFYGILFFVFMLVSRLFLLNEPFSLSSSLALLLASAVYGYLMARYFDNSEKSK